MAEWNEFSPKRILEVKQRIQTVVVYEELIYEDQPPERKEAIVDSYDRPMQAQYT
jgi:hypothetical protein